MDVGFIGLGRMGGGMCRNLIKAWPSPVHVFDLDDEAVKACVDAGGHAAARIADLAASCDVILTSLPGPVQMEAVMLGDSGIVHHARPGTVCIDLTTNSPLVVRRVGDELGQRGVSLLDAPVSGGPSGAAAGTLAIMVGGDDATFEAHRDVLEVLSGTLIHVGALGAGCVAKLVNNLMVMSSLASSAEALMLAAAAGVDPRRVDEAVRASTGDSLVYRHIADRAFAGDYSPTFAMDLAYKDVHLALELADHLNVPAPQGAQAHNLMRMARGYGHGSDDPCAVMRVYERVLGRQLSGNDATGA